MWEQEPPKPKAWEQPKPILLWSTRGKLIQITDHDQAVKLLKNRWKMSTDEELLRWKVGQYNPLYDLGEALSRQIAESNIVIKPTKIGRYLKLIKV